MFGKVRKKKAPAQVEASRRLLRKVKGEREGARPSSPCRDLGGKCGRRCELPRELPVLLWAGADQGSGLGSQALVRRETCHISSMVPRFPSPARLDRTGFAVHIVSAWLLIALLDPNRKAIDGIPSTSVCPDLPTMHLLRSFSHPRHEKQLCTSPPMYIPISQRRRAIYCKPHRLRLKDWHYVSFSPNLSRQLHARRPR